jgi:Putative Na+/H+ antiporter
VLSTRRAVPDIDEPEVATVSSMAPLLPVPVWLTVAHVLFMAWTVMNSHYPGLFLAGFLFFIGLARATAPYQSQIDLKAPMLVGFFLAGLVIHGGLQGWWIALVLASLSETPLYFGATVLTAFNDNALITYLATLVPTLTDSMKGAVVEGAVTGGGLTVIANAPNPAGQALLGKFFGDAVEPLWLAVAALLPTLITIVAFRLV